MQWIILSYNLHTANVKKATKKQKSTTKNEKTESIFNEKVFSTR